MFLDWMLDQARHNLVGLVTTLALLGLPFLVSRGFLRKVPQWTGRGHLRLMFCHLCSLSVLFALGVLLIGDFIGYLFFMAVAQVYLLIFDAFSPSKPASASR
jgi:hypothetical protein